MKLGLAAAGLILVAGFAVGCGGGSDGGGDGQSAEEKTASKDDFCAAIKDFDDQHVTGDEDKLGEILKKAADQIESVGVPEGMPNDARAGLRLTLRAIDGLPDDATTDDLAAIQGGYSDEDKADLAALTTYLAATCPPSGA
ncbi:MAG TPA: hypothetical protein PLZ93_22410 [Nocardioides sp.]|uniref:hypothetical protein n=1 Tax=uncultured Nocardioides sp. TaxID=198441 RepID=UPI000ED88182|nr:hypothetical protein [uncultured Nocardioides sp.]HCB06875.1 hypothetical protein [Nocardioides sp.]HRD64300.1 hypothetical protein [Nocardioides sp.]HRI98395.1 hypothetical protein [Nocardioides sp.]